MPYPPEYNRGHDYLQDEVDGRPTLDGNALNSDLDAVSDTANLTRDNLALIQRSDGALASGIVGQDQMADGLFDELIQEINDGVQLSVDEAKAWAEASEFWAGQSKNFSESALDSAANAGSSEGKSAANALSTTQDATSAQLSATQAGTSAVVASNAANNATGQAARATLSEFQSMQWAELLAGPVMPQDPANPTPIPPGSAADWVEAVDDGHWSARWWAWWLSKRWADNAGPAGPPGDDGAQGEDGEPGPPGQDGGGLTLIGSSTVAEMNARDPLVLDPGDSWLMTDAGTITSGIAPIDVIIDDLVGSGESGEWVNFGQFTAIPGPAGPAGEDGVDGIDGVDGALGPQGPIGLTGADSTVPGPAGDDGADGLQGIQGEQGIPGEASTVPGPIGPQGDPGDPGEQGIPGEDGVDGGIEEAPIDGTPYEREDGAWVPAGTGGGTPGEGGGRTESPIVQPAHGFLVKDVVRWDGVAWVKALADDINTTGLGLVVDVADADNFTFAMSGRYELAGYLVDTWYYLSDTVAGGLIDVEPGISQPMVYSEDGTTIIIYPYRPSYSVAGTPPEGIEEAPEDGTPYERQDGEWVPAGAGGAPSGFFVGEIKAFTGDILTLPAGWFVADGLNGTLNLMGKTIMGAGANGVVDAVDIGAMPVAGASGNGGTHGHTVSVAVGGAHSHSIVIASDGEHAHSSGSLAAGDGGSHNHSGVSAGEELFMSQMPSGWENSIMLMMSSSGQSDAHDNIGFVARGGYPTGADSSAPVSVPSAAGNMHSHGIYEQGDHQHPLTGTTSTRLDHSHPGSAAVSDSGHGHSGSATAVGDHSHSTPAGTLPPGMGAYWIQYVGVTP